MEHELRRAARLVAVDSRSRALLFQYAQATGQRFWAAPGGGVELGETFEEAAARAAVEELGLNPVHLEPVCDRTADFPWGDRQIHQQERLFLLHHEPWEFDERVRDVHRRERVLQARWWSLAEIEESDELIFPEDLPAALREAAKAVAANPGTGPSILRPTSIDNVLGRGSRRRLWPE